MMGTGPLVGPPAFISVPSLGGRSGSGARVLGAGEGVFGGIADFLVAAMGKAIKAVNAWDARDFFTHCRYRVPVQ
jgi:hypothetical protein